jgi:NRAMP (natural resistance-associated macrophage protein)-like metal ion transporter
VGSVALAVWRSLGPGFVTGAADDDPSGIATYAIVGSVAGYSLLWVALVTFPMMSVVQEMCARIALAGRCGLATAMRRAFPAPLVRAFVVLVVGANTLNAAADLAGMSAAATLVTHVDGDIFVLGFAAIILVVEFRYAYRILDMVAKVCCLALLAYAITAVLVRPPWGLVIRSLIVPEFHGDAAWLAMLVGFLGTTITPYLFFWQAAQEIEEHDERPIEVVIRSARWETVRGMLFSNLISASIVVATAATLHVHHRTVTDAADAAAALRPLAGQYASSLFALGLIGAGLVALPVLTTSSAYALAELFGWREGLSERPARARGFYATIAAGAIVSVALNFAHVDPIKALFVSAIVNGFVAVPLIAAITLLAGTKRIVGSFVNPPYINVVAWATVALMGVAAILLVWSFFVPAAA